MADNLLSSRENAIIYLSAQGKATSEIAEALGISVSNASKTLREERIQFEIKRLRHKLFGHDTKAVKKRFDDMVEGAQNVIQEIIDNPNSAVKPQLRFNAAQEVLDRSLGKPKQTVEHQGSLIKELFDRLDDPNSSKIIDIEPMEDELPALLAQSAEPQKIVEQQSVDDFIKEHL